MPLTGKFSFRRSLFGKVIMTVEEEVKAVWPFSRSGATRKRWRDATLLDLTHPQLRLILEFRDGAKAPADAAAPPAEGPRPQKQQERSHAERAVWRHASPEARTGHYTNGH